MDLVKVVQDRCVERAHANTLVSCSRFQASMSPLGDADISRELSSAIPPDPDPDELHPGRDATTVLAGVECCFSACCDSGIPAGMRFFRSPTGGIAMLNPRLISASPTGDKTVATPGPKSRLVHWGYGLKCTTIFLAITLVLLTITSAEDKKPEPPKITSVEPVTLVPGFTGILKLRGFQLKTTQQFQFTDAPNIKVEVKDKKDPKDIPGMEKKDIGDSQVEIQLTVPADQPATSLTFTVQTEAGPTPPVKIDVLSAFTDEKEPNNGFREAQAIQIGQPVRGNINQDKDVDVFRFTAKAGEEYHCEVTAARALSLMDAALVLYDAKGAMLAQADDTKDLRDPIMDFTIPQDGQYFVAVTDAHDHGGEWHSYELLLQTKP